MKTETQRVRIPISLKLITIFSTLIVIVLGVTTYMISTLVRSDEQAKAEENNLTINGRTAETVEEEFINLQNNAAGLLNTLSLIPSSDQNTAAQNLFADFCARIPETICISGPLLGTRYNASFTSIHDGTEQKLSAWIKNNPNKDLQIGEVEIKNISSLFQAPVLCILFPYKVNNYVAIATVAFSANQLVDTLSTGSFNTTFLINKSGDILIHPDFKRMNSGENLLQTTAIKGITSSKLDNSQTMFSDENGENSFYAYHKIAGDIYVITCETEKTIFESIDRTTYRIVLFSLAVLFLAILIIRIFSKTLTYPIRALVDASHQIENGVFALDLKPRTKDEIGVLTSSFLHMSKGLAERERLKTTFSKFTNKTIAERALKGELVLGGETRNATVFFSDIRSFTAMSEKLKPQEVVDMLNSYMTRMVTCVNKTGGVVDKYIGDSIMAVWGAPESGVSPEADAWNSVLTALLMRKELYIFNKERTAKGKPVIRIGCGINTGSVVAGQIGSTERMEYTVIGDTVNFASRTESLNKLFATDILITENTYDLIKDKVVVEEMPAVTVKGKEKPVKIFAVLNAVGIKGPKNIEQLRSFLGVEAPDLDKVDPNAEEKKYKLN